MAAQFLCALLTADGVTVTEWRSYPQEMQVGQGALGEFANMRAATPQEIATLAASSRPEPPTPRQWLERLAPTTQAAIAAAGAGNPSVLLWLLKAAGTPSIDVTAPETVAGVGALVAAGVITAADQATLLAP